ncbi:MAG: hypothetical protein ACOH2V_08490 [Candidatus Saccharimonadaceae bacterium]
MEQKLEFGNCYYQSSFFNMKIDLPIDLTDLNTIPDGALGLYFHEYIHFIQDISTIYGLMNISTVNYYIQACAHYISKIENDSEFEVPILLNSIIDTSIGDFGLLNMDLKPIYLGSNINPKFKEVKNLSYSTVSFHLSNNQIIEKVKVKFTNEINENIEFDFGGNILTEGMAYVCEQVLFKDVLPKADEYPYSIIEKIIESTYPEIVDDKILIIALCDISLMSYHPGLSFIRLLEYIKYNKSIYQTCTIDEFYEACQAHIKGGHVELDLLIDNVCSEIKKNFNADYFQDTTKWIDTLFNNVKHLRKNVPSFVIDLVRFGKPKENSFFMNTFKFLGSPLTLNADGQGTISLPINFNPSTEFFMPGIFMAINQVLRIFYLEKPSECKLMSYCRASSELDSNIVIDSNCKESPWKKSLDKNPCPVGQIWRHWALKEYSPKYK